MGVIPLCGKQTLRTEPLGPVFLCRRKSGTSRRSGDGGGGESWGGGGGPEAEFYGGPAPRGWRTVPEGRAGGGSAGVRGRGVARGLVAASGAVVAGRRKGRPRSPFLRGDTAGTFPRRRFLSRERQGLLRRPVPRPRGGGKESLGSILVRGHGRNFSAAAVFEPAGSTSDAGNGYLCIRLRRCASAACGAALRLTATHDRFCRH